MPFGRVQFVLFWLYQVLVLIWQWPLWPPLSLLYFAAVSLAVWKELPEQPVWPGALGAVALVSLGAVFLPHTSEHALFAMFNVVTWIFLWRRQNVTDYLLVFILNIASLFLLLVIRPDALARGLMLSPLFFPVFIAAIFFLVLRYDMETHYIVKHRLGRQSRRVEVGRLLQSRRVLDVPMLGLILGTGLAVTGLAQVAGYAAAPVLGQVQWTRVVPTDFPQALDVGRLGRPVITGRAQLTVRAEDTAALQRAVYWRGQVFDHYTNGMWLRATFSWLPALEPGASPAPCARMTVEHDNATLSDGYAPLAVQWARSGAAGLRLSSDGRVRPAPRTRQYTICVSTGGGAVPGAPPAPARVPDQSPVALWSRPVVSPSAGFDANVSAVLRFLENYGYDEAYPRVPAGRDPLVHFLGFEKAGPCGLFASVAVVFLTHAGIPARLVTGFSHGKLSGGVRRFTDADAHSWVEAWHPQRGWVTLDPTRSARLSWRSRENPDPARVRLGWIVAASIPSFLVLFWLGLRVSRRRIAGIVALPQPQSAPIRKISQTKLEAQLLFQELVSGPRFANSPRLPGEAAMNFARRLEAEGHPGAGVVREAAELAGRILFSRIEAEDKVEFLLRLRKIRHG